MTAKPPATSVGSGAGTPSTVTGWIEAACFVGAIGALTLVYAIGDRLGAHPIAFVLYAIVTAAGAMLAITGLGADWRPIARHPASWLVGGSLILVEAFYYLAITYVPPAHGNIVFRFAIPIAMLTGFALFGRRQAPLAVVATLVVTLATGYVVALADPAVRWPLAACGLVGAVCLVVRGFAGEFHPWNRAARTVRDKLRVTGIVMLVTSFIAIVLAALLAGAIAASIMPPLRVVPTAAQMLHVPTILLGTLAGGGILALMNYLNFASVVKIGTENFTAAMALSPVTAWLFQEIGVTLGWIVAVRPSPPLLAAMAVIVASVLGIVWAGRHGPAAGRRREPETPGRGPLDSDP